MEELVTFHATRVKSLLPARASDQGKVIGVGVHIYICGHQKKFESYFSDRLTFSNIRGRTSRRIYRLALPPLSPEMLSSLSKLRIFLFICIYIWTHLYHVLICHYSMMLNIHRHIECFITVFCCLLYEIIYVRTRHSVHYIL